MKTVTLAAARTDFGSLLELVTAGEEVEIMEDHQPVARLVPPPCRDVDWSASFARLEAIWGGQPLPGKPGSRIVIEGRR